MGSSIIVVDNGLADSVKEYAQIIDGVRGNDEFSKSVESHLLKRSGDDQVEIGDKRELYEKIKQASTAEVLGKLTDKEFEPTIYLLIHVLAELTSVEAVLSDESFAIDRLVVSINPTHPLSLRDRKSIKSSSVVSILSTIFNLLPQASKVRGQVLKEILKVLETSGITFSSVQENLGSNIVSWLKSSNASESEIKAAFWDFIALDSLYSLKSLHFIKNFTHSYSLTENELTKMIEFALKSKVVDVSFLVNNNVAKALDSFNDCKLSQLFLAYVKGELIQIENIPSNLPQEFIHQKSKILSLAKYFADSITLKEDHDGILFTYEEVPNISSELEFQELIVEAITAGIVEGKLNQIDNTFSLSRVNRFVIAGDNSAIAQSWEIVKAVLQQWSQSISNIDEIVRQTRENIVNGGTN
ncbi:hypothetical protein KGF56_003565 [Candida oxycetoniae]|uniref:PCI domain-containing protein n=1 Tax=Candida oxycetoniae TaxID=497107 RepID=A0AAI9WX32_9ASCO|nr:uncharacterized protein KGF56_003565 [Candida oxycetoniae]KAI3403638.2 hypothetical protein KGF56_003565 [Candida oxycetoniae]